MKISGKIKTKSLPDAAIYENLSKTDIKNKKTFN